MSVRASGAACFRPALMVNITDYDMKKYIFTLALMLAAAIGSNAQTKIAMIDMEYILRNVPAYEMANEQLNQASLRWEKEVAELSKESDTLFKNYEADMIFMTDEQKKEAQAEIVAKDKEVTETRYKYFGPEGELYKKRQSLVKPIQEEVYNAVKAVADEKGYKAIFDRASSQSIIYASPTIDVSNEVLAKLGYSK